MSRLVALATVAALAAAACGTGGNAVEAPPIVTVAPSTTEPTDLPSTTDATEVDTTTVPAGPSSTDAPAPPLPPVTIEQVDCPAELSVDGLACALATVPIDRQDATAGTTTISIAALPGRASEQPRPMAVLQGGPGGASTELTLFYPRRDFTQVFIDQRGTGFGAADFDCPELDAALVDILALPSEEAASLELAAYDACALRLGDDPVFEHTDTEALAADVADVMVALGYEDWVAYGVSFGTTIALQLMRTDPVGLTGAVLDSVYPIDLDVDAGIAGSAASSLAELDSACAADPGCAQIQPDVTGTLEDLMARLAAEPITVALGPGETSAGEAVEVLIDGEVLAGMVFRFMYSESRLRYVPGVLEGLDREDQATARWLARSVVDISLSSIRANDDGTWFAVQCADRLPFTSGPPSGLDDFPEAIADPGLAELCEPWPREPADPNLVDPVVSDLPTLLVGGQFDPITPPGYALEVAGGLDSSTVAIRPGRAHGVWFGDECVAAMIDSFMLDPGAPVDITCAADPVPVNWRRPVGG